MVRTSCIRCPPGPGTRAQQTTSALPTSKAATRSMTSGSSVSTCIALASALLRRNLGGHPWELQGTANLILVLEAHETAHSTAPGARLQNGLDDQATTTSTGNRAPFSARNGAPRQGPMGLQRLAQGLGPPLPHRIGYRDSGASRAVRCDGRIVVTSRS